MRYCFSGHESFPCKSMWLKKGYDYLVEHNKFTDPDAVVKLGVGKNMVQSIKFWLRAFDLLKDDEVTEIARYIFNDRDGKDPYAEDNTTLWILHYLLVVSAVSSIYRLVFVDLQRERKNSIKIKFFHSSKGNVMNRNRKTSSMRILLRKILECFCNLILHQQILRLTRNMRAS